MTQSRKGTKKLVDRGFDITEGDIEEFARNDINKKEKLLKIILEDYSNNLYNQVANWRKKIFQQIE